MDRRKPLPPGAYEPVSVPALTPIAERWDVHVLTDVPVAEALEIGQSGLEASLYRRARNAELDFVAVGPDRTPRLGAAETRSLGQGGTRARSREVAINRICAALGLPFARVSPEMEAGPGGELRGPGPSSRAALLAGRFSSVLGWLIGREMREPSQADEDVEEPPGPGTEQLEMRVRTRLPGAEAGPGSDRPSLRDWTAPLAEGYWATLVGARLPSGSAIWSVARGRAAGFSALPPWALTRRAALLGFRDRLERYEQGETAVATSPDVLNRLVEILHERATGEVTSS